MRRTVGAVLGTAGPGATGRREGVEGSEDSDCVPRVWPRGLSDVLRGVLGAGSSWERTLSANRIASRPGLFSGIVGRLRRGIVGREAACE